MWGLLNENECVLILENWNDEFGLLSFLENLMMRWLLFLFVSDLVDWVLEVKGRFVGGLGMMSLRMLLVFLSVVLMELVMWECVLGVIFMWLIIMLMVWL